MKRRKSERRKIFLIKMVLCLVVCAGIAAALKLVLVSRADVWEKVVISLKPEAASMRQEQELPKIKAGILVSGNEQQVLDEKTGYKVLDLVNEIKNGEHFEIVNEADPAKEGTYALKIQLSDEMKEKLQNELKNLVEIRTEDGVFTVKNKYGDWEKSKFKKADGTYATDEFLKMGENTYYFNTEGNMVTGEMEKGNKKYVFSDQGILVSEEFTGLDPEKPMIALTFDDGPGKDTERLLDALEKYNVRATFFMVGPNAKARPETVKRMKELNCELGNHSTNHPQLTKLSAEGIKKEINTTSEAVGKATGGAKPTVMRPPYGAVNASVKQNVGLPIIMWSVDTLDWKTKNVESTVKSLMNAKDGDIVLLHDIHKPSVDAAIEAIPKLLEKGFQLVTVSELAEARKGKLELGIKYFSFYK